MLVCLQISSSPNLVDSKREIRPERHKQRNGQDLPHQAGDHEVFAIDGSCMGYGCGCDAPACALQDECEEIATDEDVGVGAWSQSRILATIDRDETGEAQIDRGCNECRCDGEADEVAVMRFQLQTPGGNGCPVFKKQWRRKKDPPTSGNSS